MIGSSGKRTLAAPPQTFRWHAGSENYKKSAPPLGHMRAKFQCGSPDRPYVFLSDTFGHVFNTHFTHLSSPRLFDVFPFAERSTSFSPRRHRRIASSLRFRLLISIT
jgi:hypothetical protein